MEIDGVLRRGGDDEILFAGKAIFRRHLDQTSRDFSADGVQE